MKRYTKSVFIFRRDLRLMDNTALNAALEQSEQVLLCFIFDPRQINPHPYQSRPALQFMLQALRDLEQQISSVGGVLLQFFEMPEAVISLLQQYIAIKAVFVNRDYTPFSRQRDAVLEKHCHQLGLDFHSSADVLLNEPEQLLKPDASPYQVFTPFYKRASQIPVAQPKPLVVGRFMPPLLGLQHKDIIKEYTQPDNLVLKGGRTQALNLLQTVLPHCAAYAKERDYPALAKTTQLAAYIKFGCCSIREVYSIICNTLGKNSPLLRQLYWRDFFTHIAFHFPHVFQHAFHKRYDNIVWQNNEPLFWLWAKGQTGFPIVDAGMRELNQTGNMHNRLRMITASFLVKDLLISWRWGERYFAQHLVDYDPSVNNGNWQWAASTGCDAQPFFRIFNPWLQQKKFDADCVYIKHWVPELRDFSPKTIHQWYLNPLAGDYPPPIVDHALQSSLAKKLFKD